MKKKLPFSRSKYNNDSFEEFCQLNTNMKIKSINDSDLPHELSDETCEFIDLFRRKTVNEKTEWEFYIDYENNEIIHCLHGKETNVKDWINSGLMENRNILSIHNHPKEPIQHHLQKILKFWNTNLKVMKSYVQLMNIGF